MVLYFGPKRDKFKIPLWIYGLKSLIQISASCFLSKNVFQLRKINCVLGRQGLIIMIDRPR